MKLAPCLVQVASGTLTIQAPGQAVAGAPAAGVAIVTPAAVGRIGTVVVIRVDGRRLSVAFDMVYSRRHPGGAFSTFTGAGKGMRLGHELARAFATALRAAGAADET